MPLVPFDAPVPEWPPGGSYGHSRLLSWSLVLWPVHLVPGERSLGSRGGRNTRDREGVEWPFVSPSR